MKGPKPGMASAPIPASKLIVPPTTPPRAGTDGRTFGHLCFLLVSEVTCASFVGEQHRNIIIGESSASKFSDDGVSLSFCIHKWYQHAWSYDFKLQRSYFDPHIGYNNETLLLVLAAGLLLWILAGGVIVRSILSLILKSQSAGNRAALPKRQSREGATVSRLGRPDGSELRVECYGREDAHQSF